MTDDTPQGDPDDGVILAGGEQASDADKIDGIIAQVRSDAPGDDLAEIAERLRQRFAESEVPVTDDEVAGYARRVVDDPS